MEIVYILYSVLALLGLLFNIAIFVLRVRQRTGTQLRGLSDEHRWCLLLKDLLLTLTSLIILLSMLQDVFKDGEILCNIMGYADLFIVIALSWTPLMSAIVLYEKERYSLRMKSYQGMTPKIVTFVIGAMLVISAALVSINYAPIVEFNSERHLLCVPVTFPHQAGSEYTKLLIVLIWCGLVSTWACMIAWLVFLVKNRKSVRYVTECHRSTKNAGLQATVSLSLWTISVVILTAYYWRPLEDLLLAATLFSVLYVICHPSLSLIIHWLGDGEGELGSGLSRDMPRRVIDITPLTVNPQKNATNFHSRWMGKFNEKVQAVIKVYNPNQRCKWLREAKAMAILRKTEHPSIVKYLWVGRGGSIKFPMSNVAKEYIDVLTNANSRMVGMQYYEQRSLRELLLHKQKAMTDSTLKYIALDIVQGLVHLRHLHIAHNNLNSKSIFIKSTPKSKVLTAVIGGFEESDHVTLDYHRCKNDSSKANQPQAACQLDNKFATDIRSYALLLLELVAAWNRHSGQPLKVPSNKKQSERVVNSTQNQSSVKRNPRTRTPTRTRTLSKKPRFGEIQEEPQSSLQHQQVVNGETVAIEMDPITDTADIETEASYDQSKPHAIGVIIPTGVTDSYPEKRYHHHPVVTRHGSNSACSIDSGYPKSLELNAVPGMEYDLTWAISKHGKSLPEYTSKTFSAHTNNAFNGVGEQLTVGNVQLVQTNHNNNIIAATPYPEALLSYQRAKNSLPKDILGEYEEYNINEDLTFSDEDKSTAKTEISTKLRPSISPSVMPEVNLASLAERVTQDIDAFLKTRSRSNSDVSSALGSTKAASHDPKSGADDSASYTSDASDLTFSSTAEHPLHLRLDRELFIDRIISQKHRLNCSASASEHYIYRPGITKTQLYYSKELAAMYDIVTPQLLYLSESATRKFMQAYRNQLTMPTINQLLDVSEGCWVQEPVHSAEAVLTQLRNVFTISQ